VRGRGGRERLVVVVAPELASAGQCARHGAWCRQRHRSRGRRCAGGGAARQLDAADAQPIQYVDPRVPSAGMGGPLPGHRASARAGRARAAGGCGRRGVRECGPASTAWCVVQTTASKPRAPLRWRRRCKATRRCRRSTYTVCRPLARVHSAGMGGPLPGHLASARVGRARAAGGCGRRGVRECGPASMGWCVVQTTASKPRAPLRWRRRCKATRRCRRSTSVVCGPLARVHSAGMGGPLPGTSRVRMRAFAGRVCMFGDLARVRAARRERLVWSGVRDARVCRWYRGSISRRQLQECHREGFERR
jgi:hypothetical protein